MEQEEQDEKGGRELVNGIFVAASAKGPEGESEECDK